MSAPFLLVVGESLVDLIEEGGDRDPAYRPRYGGSPLNVAVGAARLGSQVRFVTALGSDAFGRQLAAFLREEGVVVDDEKDDARRTCLALATRVEGHIEYEYFGDPLSMVDILEVPGVLRDSFACG
jgi:fructokinase